MNHHRLVRCFRTIASVDVERGPDGAPTAFRIWRAGENATDHGSHVFSDRSAKLLLAEQAVRGNLYSVDVDHMSLDKEAPPESHKAVGWHRLEVRGGDLWAVDVVWTDSVRAGLTKDPPEWRYFSPAYDVDTKTNEVTSYLNTALTNNPATWSVTALATRKGMSMDYKDAVAAALGDDDDKKAEARAALAKMAEGDDDDAKKAKRAMAALFGEPDGEKKEEKKDTESAPDGDGDKSGEEKRAAAAAATVSATREAELLKQIGAQDARLRELEQLRETDERAHVLATRPDLSAAQRTYLEKQPVARVRELLALIPAPPTDPAAAVTVTATRGAGRTGDGASDEFGSRRAARLPKKEHEELRARMSGESTQRTIGWDKVRRNDLVFPQITKEEAKRILSSRKAEGRDGPAARPMGGA